MKKYIILLLFMLSDIDAQPGCRQVGNRLEKSGDSKGLEYVSCSCPCNQYEQYAKKLQCAECKHYPMLDTHGIKILTNVDIHKAHRKYLESLK